MGSFDQLVLDALKDGSRKSFRAILAKSGMSHNTLKRYLQRLMTEGLVSRTENARNRRGRPEYRFCQVIVTWSLEMGIRRVSDY